MAQFRNLVKQFHADERGMFGMIFALLAVMLIALGGATVDFVRLEQTRNRAQVALDAAALALQKDIFITPLNTASIKAQAQALVTDRIGDAQITATLNAPVVDIPNGSLFLSAQVTVPTIFVSLVGVQTMSAGLVSEATRKKLSLEVMMVLDNSGSMTEVTSGGLNRMDYLKLAANCAAYTLYYDAVKDGKKADGSRDPNTCVNTPSAKLVDNVRVGIVPFTMYVNVGANNKNASWIDTAGISPIANDNFDDDDDETTPFTAPVNRLALYDQLSNVNWQGCVEARPHESTGGANHFYDTDDTAALSSDPSSLFVPLFAPDLSEQTTSLSAYNYYNNYTSDTPATCQMTGSCQRHIIKRHCNSNFRNCDSSYGDEWDVVGPKSGGQSCSCSGATTTTTDWTNQTSTWGEHYRIRTQSCAYAYDPQGLSERELQERLCKYNGAMRYTTGQRGPNADCPTQPIVPLTAANKTSATPIKTITDAINAMVPDGGTNIHEGTAWGMRALTPAAPFTEGQSSTDGALSKVMIVMTDGENTAYQRDNLNGALYYSAYGFPYNSNNASASYGSNINRLGSINSRNADLVTGINERLLQTCANAKDQHITIYTIGLATDKSVQSTQQVVEDMLTACASAPAKAFFPRTPEELKTVFASIANELAALRIAQ